MPKSEPLRCEWGMAEPLRTYHDTEWGVPTRDEHLLYELFLLEAFQAGLSWRVILNKREGFRRAFDNFDAQKIAAYGDADVARLMEDAGIVRCRRKIEGAIVNARIYLDIVKEFGSFYAYLHSFTGGHIAVNETDEMQTTSDVSDKMSADLKKRGMRYMGSVTLYSYLQAVGVVCDHELRCFRHPNNAPQA